MGHHFLRKNWLAITGLAIGVVGIALSTYFYWGSRRYREPVFVEDPIRTELLSHDRVAQVPIRVLRADGEPIGSDLVSIRFYFWNDGTEPIRGEHVLEQITLSLDETAVEILDFRLLSISRDLTGLALNRNPTNPKRSLVLSFSILETDDGATGQIIFEGPSSSQLTIGGVVEGVSSITSTADIEFLRTWYEYLTIPLLGLILGMIVVLGLRFAIGGFRTRLVGAFEASLQENIKSPRLRKYISRCIFAAIVLLLVVGPLVLAIVLDRRVNENARKSVAQAVPSKILPE